MPTAADDALARAHRGAWAGVVGAVARTVRDLDLAEDSAAEAFAQAAERWPRDGVPGNPTGWLVTAARRRALDQLRRRDGLTRRLPLLVVDDAPREDAERGFDEAAERVDREAGREVPAVFGSDLLRLLFTCCHPALARESQVALTARLVCGLRTDEVARLLLVPPPTAAARITRAKKKIASAGIPFRVPSGAELPGRLDAVLTVVHLLVTAGHTAPVGDGVVREDLLLRARELTGALVALMPDEAEVLAVHALALFAWARRDGRHAGSGRLLLLAEQDRSTWDTATIAEADALVRRALRRGRPGRFTLQAAVAGCHATAPSYEDTDWHEVLALYDLLLQAWPTPVVALNRAVALAQVAGPAAALDAVDGAGAPEDYPYLHAVRGHLLAALGRPAEARDAYDRAARLTANTSERAFLLARRDGLGGG
ncbi:RNA polymerase sigma factor [Aquipuribacter sp. SD81]|uniref:RNA polymerase sigma factor n=1 Tax=Aquipuribacter sp. SD81 TaxID=3127703 RepID=UPI003018AE0E